MASCGVLFVGDVAGDDLGLYPAMREAMGMIDAPLRFVPGNHDIDFDSTEPEHSFDTYRNNFGPENYSYDVGKTHVVVLNTVRYPCTPDVDNADGNRPECDDPEDDPRYNGRLSDDALQWLENDLAAVPKDKLVVIASHISLLNYADMGSYIHQTDQVKEVYALLEGRRAVSVAGHTHSTENLKAGDSYGPWEETMGVSELPFPSLVAGAISGDWYSGDLNEDGLPMAYQRDGGRPGLMTLDIEGNTFKERFTVRGEHESVQMSVGVNSPTWRTWYNTLSEWRADNPNDDEGATPPVNYNDLGDPHMLTPKDLADGSWVTSNFWMGSTDSSARMRIADGDWVQMERTQSAEGEEQLVGAEYADPAAATRQLTVGRTSYESTSGDPLAQGYRLYRGSQYGPGPARPGNNVADRMPHLWTGQLPKDLEEGMYPITVEATDAHGRTFTDHLAITVVKERPQMEFRTQLFQED